MPDATFLHISNFLGSGHTRTILRPLRQSSPVRCYSFILLLMMDRAPLASSIYTTAVPRLLSYNLFRHQRGNDSRNPYNCVNQRASSAIPIVKICSGSVASCHVQVISEIFHQRRFNEKHMAADQRNDPRSNENDPSKTLDISPNIRSIRLIPFILNDPTACLGIQVGDSCAWIGLEW